MKTVIINHYVPSKISGNAPKLETFIIDVRYTSAHPCSEEMTAVNHITKVYEKISNVHFKVIAEMIQSGKSSHVEHGSYDRMNYVTSYSCMS